MSGSYAYFNHYGEVPPHDKDLDFLNDDFEYEIANHFKPILHCYADDTSCTGTPDIPLPVTLFQVSPIDCNQYDFSPVMEGCSTLDENSIYLGITYTMLWAEDTGMGEFDYSYLSPLDCADRFLMTAALKCGIATVGPRLIPCAYASQTNPDIFIGCILSGIIDPLFLTCITAEMLAFSDYYDLFSHCMCNQPFIDNEDFYSGLFETIGIFYPTGYEDTYHNFWRGGHFGDNNYFRVFVKANKWHPEQWSIFGFENATGTRVSGSDLPECPQQNIYLSYGKKHQYIIPPEEFESSSTPGKVCLRENSYSGDYYKDDNSVVNWAIDPCGECFDLDRMVEISPEITNPNSPDGFNEVGSLYKDIFLDRDGQIYRPMQRIDGINYLLNSSVFHSSEDAWDCGDDDECGDHYFCGSGYRMEENYCCAHDYYTPGEEWCDRIQASQTASGVGSNWLLSARTSGFDNDGYTCFSMGLPGVDYQPGSSNACPPGLFDKCPLVSDDPAMDSDGDNIGNFCDNCPDIPNPYQEDADGDGFGDICDMCPHNARHFAGDDADGDTLMDWCDLCPEPVIIMNRNGEASYGWVPFNQRDIDDKYLEGNEENNYDGDELGNRCDKCKYVRSLNFDDDNDGLGNECDLCPRQHPEDIGLPGFEFVKANFGPCDIFDCRYGIVYLDSKDEPVSQTALKRQHDFDGDGVGNLCDNCTFVANASQKNCNDEWERSTRYSAFPGQFKEEEDIEGNACDPEPCTRAYHPINWRIHSNYNPVEIGYDCPEISGPRDLPPEAYAFLEIPVEHYGYNESAFGMDYPLVRQVINGYCDCAGYMGEECERNQNCVRYGRLRTDDGLGWYNPSRMIGDIPEYDIPWPEIPSTGESPFVTEKSNFTHSYIREYRGNDGRKNCYDYNIAGCTYETSWENHEKFFWDFINDLGRGPAHYVRMFFKPDDLRFTDEFWPGYILKNTYYEFYQIKLPCVQFRRFPVEELGGGSPGEYNPFQWEKGCPGPGITEELKDKVLISTYPCWVESQLVGRWRYEEVKESSAIQGLRIVQFDRNRNDFHAVYRSIFESPDDIIDTEGFSSARITGLTPPVVVYGIEESAVSGDETHDPGILWVFGGKDKVRYRNDLWRGEPVEVQNGELVYFWNRMIPSVQDDGGSAPLSQWPSGRKNAVLLADPDRNRLILWGGENDLGALNDLWIFDINEMEWKKIDEKTKIPPLSRFMATQFEGTGYLWGGFDSTGEFNTNLYMIDAKSLGIIKVETSGDFPSSISDGAISIDPSGKILYLYGGFDSAGFHNWVYTFDLSNYKWNLLKSDCTKGTCPYLSSSPAFFGNFFNSSYIVFPGISELPSITSYMEPFFNLDLSTGLWNGASVVRGDISRIGDCNGDGVTESDYGNLCTTSSDWWNLPGRMTCNTSTLSLTCGQDIITSPTIYSMHRMGVEDIETIQNYLYLTRGNSILVYDMSDPSLPNQVNEIRLNYRIVDIEANGALMAIASGRKIAILDASNPVEPVVMAEAEVCGHVNSIEFYGSSIFYLTRAGIGELSISNPLNPVNVRFVQLRRNARGQWRIEEGGSDRCGGWGSGLLLSEAFDIGEKRAFIGAWNDLLIIRITQDSFELEGKISLSSIIEDLRYDRGFVYINLLGGEKVKISVRGNEFPSIAGTHDLWDWVKGLYYSDGKVYKLQLNRIQTAVIR